MKKSDDTYQMFVAECDRAFGFMVSEYGFLPPEIHLDAEINFVIISYFKNEIAIECIFDERENNVSVKIVKLTGEKKPDVYKINDKGEVCREYLTQLLIRRGVRDIRFDMPAQGRLSRQQYYFRKSLMGYARLLTEYGQDILKGSAAIFAGLKSRKKS